METWEGSRLNEAKEILAYELTKTVHGEAEAEKAKNAGKALFGGAGEGGDVPTLTLAEEDFATGSIDVLTLLVRAGLVSSKSEARRAVEQGGVTVDGERVSDVKKTYTRDELADGKLVRRGKQRFMKVKT